MKINILSIFHLDFEGRTACLGRQIMTWCHRATLTFWASSAIAWELSTLWSQDQEEREQQCGAGRHFVRGFITTFISEMVTLNINTSTDLLEGFPTSCTETNGQLRNDRKIDSEDLRLRHDDRQTHYWRQVFKTLTKFDGSRTINERVLGLIKMTLIEMWEVQMIFTFQITTSWLLQHFLLKLFDHHK